MAKPERFVFVCTNQRPEGHPRGSCAHKGSRETIMKFAEEIDRNGLFGKVSLVQTGCLGPCFEGPVAAVFPDNVWYSMVEGKEVEAIVKEHLVGGSPVQKKMFKDKDWG